MEMRQEGRPERGRYEKGEILVGWWWLEKSKIVIRLQDTTDDKRESITQSIGELKMVRDEWGFVAWEVVHGKT